MFKLKLCEYEVVFVLIIGCKWENITAGSDWVKYKLQCHVVQNDSRCQLILAGLLIMDDELAWKIEDDICIFFSLYHPKSKESQLKMWVVQSQIKSTFSFPQAKNIANSRSNNCMTSSMTTQQNSPLFIRVPSNNKQAETDKFNVASLSDAHPWCVGFWWWMKWWC